MKETIQNFVGFLGGMIIPSPLNIGAFVAWGLIMENLLTHVTRRSVYVR